MASYLTGQAAYRDGTMSASGEYMKSSDYGRSSGLAFSPLYFKSAGSVEIAPISLLKNSRDLYWTPGRLTGSAMIYSNPYNPVGYSQLGQIHS